MKAEEFMLDLEATLGLCFDLKDERMFLEILEQYYDPKGEVNNSAV